MAGGSTSVVLRCLPVLAALLAGCGDPTAFTEEERKILASLSLDALGPMPDDPSNRFAADPQAASLGEDLFFDTSLSADSTVACASCHLPDRQFQDDRQFGIGVGVTDRRTMPLAGAARSTWFFWDGRKDSAWAQALGPLEDPREHGMTRTALAHAVAAGHRESYEELFGPLPMLDELPGSAGPLGSEEERAAWAALSPARRGEIDFFFANIGKALAAFQRGIEHSETRFDRFARAVSKGEEPAPEAAFSDLETEGLKLFIGKANCIDCHNGPRFTDEHFHNTGVPALLGAVPARGRADAVAKLDADPFNCLGEYSDAAPGACGELRFMLRDSDELVGAFKTPSLRGAASRPPYMHAGQVPTLEGVIDHYEQAAPAAVGQNEVRGVVLTERGRAALIAFLRTLDAEN